MSRMYNITIPTKPHIQKFFHSQEGSPILPKHHPLLWLMVRPYLEYKVSDGLSIQQRKNQLFNLKGRIIISLSVSKVKLYGLQVKASSVIVINKLLDYYFGKELFNHVKACEQNPGRYKGFTDAIEKFCKIHGIELEEDISTEALLNQYKRHRKNQDNTFGSKKVSPALA